MTQTQAFETTHNKDVVMVFYSENGLGGIDIHFILDEYDDMIELPFFDQYKIKEEILNDLIEVTV